MIMAESPKVQEGQTMKNKVVPILASLLIIGVLLMAADPGFRDIAIKIIDPISEWLGIDWGIMKRWLSA
jgi:hypothetical protein